MNKHYWTWPIACYLFLGGLGGGMLTLAFVFEALCGLGDQFAFASLVGVACLAFGCGLLIFELGQPTKFWRVFFFSNTAIIKWGAVILSVAMVAAVIHFTFYLPWAWIPWAAVDGVAGYEGARYFFGAIMALFGFFTMVYTGVLLSSLKARPFWNTPALPVLFTVSALSTASALCALVIGVWPAASGPLATLLGIELLHLVDTILIVTEMVVILLFVLLMRGASNLTAQRVADRWLRGSFASAFWGGMMFGGLVLPLLLYAGGGFFAASVAPLFVLAGGLLLRFLIVYSDDRREIPGETQYHDRLPKGDEAFLKAWK